MYKFKNGLGYFNEDLPRKKWRGIICVDCMSMVNVILSGTYNGVEFKGLRISEYIPVHSKENKKNPQFKIMYNNNEYTVDCNSLLNGSLAKILGIRTNEFKYKIGKIFNDDKRDLIITDKEYRPREDNNKLNWKWYKYTCNKCGWTEGWIKEANLKVGDGCSCCYGRTAVSGINTIYDKAPWMCDLGVSKEDAKKYTPQSNKKIEVVCPDCGSRKKIELFVVYSCKSIGCTCGDGRSYICKYITSLLDQLRVCYNTEVKYDWNKYINPKNNKLTQASIDFVIYKDEREIPLEADGAFHRKDNSMRGATAEMQQYIDKQRDYNCLKHLGEETIRISDEGDIKENILNSKLAIEFDLNNIDWSKCEEFALKNIVKEVCEYWNHKENWETVTDLGKIFALDRHTISRYLKKGTKLGWVNYNSKEEVRKSVSKNGKSNSKSVEIFKDGISLGIFESCAELERQSEDLFGVKLLTSKIGSVCLGNRKHHKGFTFKYV